MTVMHPHNVRRFLKVLAETRKVREAAAAVGISQSTLYQHRRNNPSFRAAWAEALELGEEMLTREALRRAVEGVEQPVFYRGEKVGSVRKYNDSMLIQAVKLATKRRQDREARQRDEEKDELSEILELIDGKTRGIHQG